MFDSKTSYTFFYVGPFRSSDPHDSSDRYHFIWGFYCPNFVKAAVFTVYCGHNSTTAQCGKDYRQIIVLGLCKSGDVNVDLITNSKIMNQVVFQDCSWPIVCHLQVSESFWSGSKTRWSFWNHCQASCRMVSLILSFNWSVVWFISIIKPISDDHCKSTSVIGYNYFKCFCFLMLLINTMSGPFYIWTFITDVL